MRFIGIALVLTAFGLLLAACSGGSAKTNGVSAEFYAAAANTAQNSLLSLPDFPEGWTREPRNENEPKLGLTGDCAVLEAEGLPGEVAHASSGLFYGQEGQRVNSGTSVFATIAKGEHAFTDLAATQDDCSDELTSVYKKALEDQFEAEGIPITELSVSFKFLDAPSGVDDGMAYQLLTTMTSAGQPMEFVIDGFVLRQGRVLGYVNYYDRGQTGSAEEGQLVTVLAAKMEEGDAALPSG